MHKIHEKRGTVHTLLSRLIGGAPLCCVCLLYAFSIFCSNADLLFPGPANHVCQALFESGVSSTTASRKEKLFFESLLLQSHKIHAAAVHGNFFHFASPKPNVSEKNNTSNMNLFLL